MASSDCSFHEGFDWAPVDEWQDDTIWLLLAIGASNFEAVCHQRIDPIAKRDGKVVEVLSHEFSTSRKQVFLGEDEILCHRQVLSHEVILTGANRDAKVRVT